MFDKAILHQIDRSFAFPRSSGRRTAEQSSSSSRQRVRSTDGIPGKLHSGPWQFGLRQGKHCEVNGFQPLCHESHDEVVEIRPRRHHDASAREGYSPCGLAVTGMDLVRQLRDSDVEMGCPKRPASRWSGQTFWASQAFDNYRSGL